MPIQVCLCAHVMSVCVCARWTSWQLCIGQNANVSLSDITSNRPQQEASLSVSGVVCVSVCVCVCVF